jgi:hypothetical protein
VDEKWMNKEAVNGKKKKFMISHSTYDDLPKKHFGWMKNG